MQRTPDWTGQHMQHFPAAAQPRQTSIPTTQCRHTKLQLCDGFVVVPVCLPHPALPLPWPAGISKVGHAGTLDPNASGLLIVCTGEAPRRQGRQQGRSGWVCSIVAVSRHLALVTTSRYREGAVAVVQLAHNVRFPELHATTAPPEWVGCWGWYLAIGACAAVLQAYFCKHAAPSSSLLPPPASLSSPPGTGTKSIDSFTSTSKAYSGTLRLGEATPSQDADTPVDATAPWEHIAGEAGGGMCVWGGGGGGTAGEAVSMLVNG